MLNGWQKHPGFSVAELQATKGIRSVGTRTGLLTGPLLCFDFDGKSSLELGLYPWAANTWQIHRDTDPNRLKVLFRPTLEQIAQLATDADGSPEFLGKTLTAPKTDNSKGEALEVFFAGGRQVIVLGEHPSSGGHYFWPDALGPEELAPPPDEWWTHALRIAQNCQQKIATGTPRSATRNGSRRLDPCPICRRHSGPGGSGLWCEETTDGLVLCMPGSTFNAEQRHGALRIGQVVDGFALVKRTPISDGDVLTFRKHRPLEIPNTSNNGAARTSHQQPAAQPLNETLGLRPQSLEELLGEREEGKLWRPRTDKLADALAIVLPLRFNQLTQRIENEGQPVDGDFLGTLYLQLAELHSLEISKDRAADAATIVARRNAYHPVHDYLNSLDTALQPHDWDQIAHLCLGTLCPWAQLHLQRQLIGLVARVIQPACKLDTALVIHSPDQGIGKSSMWEALGGDWFSDSLGDLHNLKDDILQLHSAWIHEWGEIDAVVGKRESETLKKFLSARKDDVRKPYGRGVETLKRSCGIVGTTNRNDFIKDPTGNRRFPVITVNQINLDWVENNRHAIWGSALHAYRSGLPWHYTNAENSQISEHARNYSAEDPLLDAIETWTEDHPQLTEVCVARVVFDIDRSRIGDQELSRQVSRRLAQLGWQRSNTRERGFLPDGSKHDKATIWQKSTAPATAPVF
jgi:hypothetical protein